MAATFAVRFMCDTHTYNPFFSVYVQGPRPLISSISYFVHYSAQNNRRRDTFLERFILSEGGWSPAPRALISWTPPLLWSWRPQRQPFPLIDLLASPPPGDRGPGTSACTPAWPGMVYTVRPLDILCAAMQAGEGRLELFPTWAAGHAPRHGRFQLMSSRLGRISPCSSCGSLGSPATSSALHGVSRSSLVTSVILSFPSCRQQAMVQPGALTSRRLRRRPHAVGPTCSRLMLNN